MKLQDAHKTFCTYFHNQGHFCWIAAHKAQKISTQDTQVASLAWIFLLLFPSSCKGTQYMWIPTGGVGIAQSRNLHHSCQFETFFFNFTLLNVYFVGCFPQAPPENDVKGTFVKENSCISFLETLIMEFIFFLNILETMGCCACNKKYFSLFFLALKYAF